MVVAKINGGQFNGKIISTIMKKSKSDSNKNERKEIDIMGKGGLFEPVPIIKTIKKKRKVKSDRQNYKIITSYEAQREICVAIGCSGAGKSTIMGTYAKNFNKVFPENDILLFSCIDKDPAFDKIKSIQRVNLDSNLVGLNIIKEDEIKEGSLFIFDDTSDIQDDIVRDALNKIIEQVLRLGRHKNIYAFVSLHEMTSNTNFQKLIYYELHRLFFFKYGGDVEKQKIIINKKLGINKKVIDEIYKLDSHWFSFYKRAPNFYMTEHKMGIIN